MHPNPAFRQTSAEQNADFARERTFGVLSVNGPDGPLMAHVPVLLSQDATHLDLHLVRSNPIARALTEGALPAVVAVCGPDSYVSPDWYGVPDQVPTWNYVAVHLRGTLALLPEDEIRALLDRQSAHVETRLLPKRAWTTGKMTPEVLDRMLRQIVPCRMSVAKIDGTWKLGQNKPADVRLRAARNVRSSPLGTDAALLAALMLAPVPG